MVSRADTTVDEWQRNNLTKYDTAQKGRSALVGATIRNLKAETAVMCGDTVACLFNDFKKFFDTMDMKTIIEQAKDTGFPLVALLYILTIHYAPRVLQVNGQYCAKPINILQSI